MSKDFDQNNNSVSMSRLFRQQKLDYEGMNNKLFQNIEILEQENVNTTHINNCIYTIIYRLNLNQRYQNYK
jgi:hypothetical protein